MKSSFFVSLLALLFAGCVSIKPSNVGRGTMDVDDDGLVVARHASRNTKYTPPRSSHLFKATLDIKKHHLTGLLMIKRMDTPPPTPPQTGNTPPPTPPQTGRGDYSGTYRIVFMNEVGMTFFDLELQPDSFKVISCFESLNKKALMKIFETDFRLLTCSGSINKQKLYRQDGTNNIVISGISGKYKIWQTCSPSGDTLYTTYAKSTIADPAIITFDQYMDGFPLKVTVENPFIGMKLSLRKLAQ